eukprot:6422961-Amphidinium_carterae.1
MRQFAHVGPLLKEPPTRYDCERSQSAKFLAARTFALRSDTCSTRWKDASRLLKWRRMVRGMRGDPESESKLSFGALSTPVGSSHMYSGP